MNARALIESFYDETGGSEWWMDPDGQVISIGDSSTHADWALDNVLMHWLDDQEEYDPDRDPSDALAVCRAMYSLGYLRLKREGTTLWADGAKISALTRRSAVDFAIENGLTAVNARNSREL